MKRTVLKLYKELLRYSENLKYTDKQYFRQRIRWSFDENKRLTDKEDISFQLQKGQQLLINQRVV